MTVQAAPNRAVRIPPPRPRNSRRSSRPPQLLRRGHGRGGPRRTIAAVLMCLLFSVYVAQWRAAADTSTATISTWSGHNDGATSTYSFSFTGSPHYLHVHIDSDNATTTGYQVGGIGADYMVENGVLYQHSGSGGSWSWSRIGAVQISLTSAAASYTVQRSQTGETSARRATVVFQTNDVTGEPLATTPPYEHIFSPATGPITSYWAENDASMVSYHATFSPVGSWNHVFIDSDSGSSTGLPTAGIGADRTRAHPATTSVGPYRGRRSACQRCPRLRSCSTRSAPSLPRPRCINKP